MSGGIISDILHERTRFDFVGTRRRWFAFSAVIILAGLIGLIARGGFTLGIDFDGGTAWQVPVERPDPSVADVRDLLNDEGVTDAKIVILGSGGDESIRVQAERVTRQAQDDVAALLAEYAGATLEDVSITDVGPTWGEEVSNKAIRALVLFFVVVAVYLSLRFEPKMAIAALAAVLHDILVTGSAYAATGFEVSPATVIALLTILGFSLYDTVVVFDKVKENADNLSSSGKETYTDVVNRSMNEVLMRSLNTTFVAVLPVFSLLVVGSYLFGALTIRDFALALTIGLLAGTYSSIFIATPLLALLKEREARYVALRERITARTAVAAAGPGARLRGPAGPDPRPHRSGRRRPRRQRRGRPRRPAARPRAPPRPPAPAPPEAPPQVAVRGSGGTGDPPPWQRRSVGPVRWSHGVRCGDGGGFAQGSGA